MKYLFFLLLTLLTTGSSLLKAQVIDEAPVVDEVPMNNTSIQQEEIGRPVGQWFIALIGGVAVQTASPTYSVTSEHLNNSSAGFASPSIGGKFGYKYNNKHQGAIVLEKTIAANSFSYSDEYGTGLGVNREISYVFVNLEYSYNLLNSKRFWLAPSVQLGVGVGDSTGSFFYDRGREAYIPIPQGISYHKYDIVNTSIPKFIFNYGVGINFGAEVIDNKFYVGVDVRWLQSFAAVHEFEIDYQNNSDYVSFKSKSNLMNLHFGLQLAYLF